MWTPEYFVRCLPFPPGVHALVQPNEDGSFDIYVNEYFDEARQRRAIEHELEHIRRDHFYGDIDLAEREAEAGGFVMLVPPPEIAPSRQEAEPGGVCELRVYDGTGELLDRWLRHAAPRQVDRLYRAGAAARKLRPQMNKKAQSRL